MTLFQNDFDTTKNSLRDEKTNQKIQFEGNSSFIILKGLMKIFQEPISTEKT